MSSGLNVFLHFAVFWGVCRARNSAQGRSIYWTDSRATDGRFRYGVGLRGSVKRRSAAKRGLNRECFKKRIIAGVSNVGMEKEKNRQLGNGGAGARMENDAMA